jgi:carboxyl-terminal processing protease
MAPRTRVLVFLLSTPFVVLILVGGLLGATRMPMAQDGVTHLRVFNQVVQMILGAYVEPVNIDKVMDGAMRGLADGLDSSSSYLTPDEVKRIESRQPLPSGDVGLTVSRQYYLRVVGVRDGSPADIAGIQTGDYIRAIGETPTRDMSTFTGTRLLRGAPGSKVTVVIIRGNPADPHPIELVREGMSEARAGGKRLAGGEAYLRVSSFENGAASALRSAVQALGPAANAGLIIDLRDVADGMPDEGVLAARLFVKSGVLSTRRGRTGEPTVVSAGSGDGALTMPIVLLVSNGTAGAAEIFASAMAGNGRGRLVGEPTAGLAAVQRLVRLPEGHGLWLTSERYLESDGTPIHGRGLAPEVLIDIPTIAFGEVPPSTDEPLNRAAEELKKLVSGAPSVSRQPNATTQPNTTTQPPARPSLPPTTDPSSPRPQPQLPARPPQSPQ